MFISFTVSSDSKFKRYSVLYKGPRVEITSGERYAELARVYKESGLTRMLSNTTFYCTNFTFHTLFLIIQYVNIFTLMSLANKTPTMFSTE